jgi:preprotein translocase subunit SecB
LSAKGTERLRVDPDRQPGLRITQVFLSHARFEYKADPLTLSLPESAAQVQMNVDVQVLDLVQENGPPVAGVRVRVRSDPRSVHPYVFDVSMGAVIESEIGQENYDPKDYVVTAGAALLYPFVREVIANLTQRGRFGAVWIPPFNMQLVMSGQAAEGRG